MKRLWTTIVLCALTGLCGEAALGEIRLIARVKSAGTASDKSGLKENLEDGTSLAQLGGWSAIAAAEAPDEYWLLPDRGPKDGAVSFPTRVHRIRLKLDVQKETTVQFELLETILLKNAEGKSLIGLSSAFTGADPATNLRFDPEGIRALPENRIAISDEYGPSVVVFDVQSGKASEWFKTPNHIAIKYPAGDPEQETAENSSGRQPNGGFEGLATQPDNNTLLAFTQKPLLQDLQAVDGKMVGSHCRVVKFEVNGKTSGEFLYPLSSSSTAVSEILGLGKSQALVLERDSAEGNEAKVKGVYWIDYSQATDSSNVASVAPPKLPAGVQASKKKNFIDFLDPKFGLAGEKMPAKPEGLAFGPKLPSGERTLIVSVDNDFESANDSELWVFAFDESDLPTP